MQISGINNVNNISSIYTYGNSNFNQVQNSPVTPVKKINRTPAVEEQENKAKYAVVYGDDKTSETYDTKEANEVKARYADVQSVSYNNTDNPYEISKRERDSMILSGMNFDEYA